MVASRRIRWPAFSSAAPAGGAGTPSAGPSRNRTEPDSARANQIRALTRWVPVLAHQVVELLPRQRPRPLRFAGLPVDRAAADLHDAEPFPVTRHDDLDVDVPDRQLVIDLQTD